MPLKYIWNQPAAVKVTGWIHGVLFILFCAALLQTILVAKWPLSRAAVAFVAALLPFGPFVIDRRMVAYDEEFRKTRRSGQDLRNDPSVNVG